MCLGICQKRADGFNAAIKEKKKSITSNVIILDANTKEDLYSKIKKLLTAENRPDGIVASVERLAMTIYLVCKEIGMIIPDQLKVVVFSTVETAPILNPSLTTITQPAFEIGRKAAELLFKQMKKKTENSEDETIILPSVLMERRSSGGLEE